MSAEDRANRKNNANLILNSLIVLIMAVGAWWAKLVYDTSSATKDAVIALKVEQVAVQDAVKVIVPRAEHERMWRGYDTELTALRADLANLRLKISSVEIDVVKLQQKGKNHEN